MAGRLACCVNQAVLERAVAVVGRGARARWWRRRGSKARGFWYEDREGLRVRDEEQLVRIAALALPPGWREVRVNPAARGRLQAVGIDAAGRVQYRYLAAFAEKRQAAKYEKIVRFGGALPALRRTASEDFCREGMPKEKVLAVITRLINELYFRVGSEASVEQNRTYGITTLRNRHVTIHPGGKLEFRFVAKSHVQVRRLLVDPELARVMGQLKRIGGARLFNYIGEDGKPHPITPHDVNGYLKCALGREFSAKDFRTWHGSLLAAEDLAAIGPPASETQAKRNIAAAMRRVAEQIGNTPTVCRNCYVHPLVLERYRAGQTIPPSRRRAISASQASLSPEERDLLALVTGRKRSESQPFGGGVATISGNSSG